MVQGLLDLTAFVGRFDGKKVRWTFFLIRLTPSSAWRACIYRKNLAEPQSETLFEENFKFMELLLSKHKDLVKIKKVKDEERGIETTYITIKKTE